MARGSPSDCQLRRSCCRGMARGARRCRRRGSRVYNSAGARRRWRWRPRSKRSSTCRALRRPSRRWQHGRGCTGLRSIAGGSSSTPVGSSSTPVFGASSSSAFAKAAVSSPAGGGQARSRRRLPTRRFEESRLRAIWTVASCRRSRESPSMRRARISDDILTHPGSTTHPVTRGTAAGGTRVIRPDGAGATFNPDGSLAYFGAYR